jgi:CheY-like chemotaxis protein
MNEQHENPTAGDTPITPRVASELNNLIQIISGTSELIENIWEGTEGSEKYFAMLRASILRAEQVTAQLVAQAGGANGKLILHPDLQKTAEPAVPAPRQPQRPCILVVDDEQMVLSLFRRVLTGGGYELVCAQSGFECLDLFGRDPEAYDLVLLDLAMPFMDGEETFERLRRISATIDVILTTGFCEERRLERMMNAGLSGYLRKPLRNEEILRLVASIIERAQGAQPIRSRDGIAAAVQDA